jgi:hypothetical protein
VKAAFLSGICAISALVGCGGASLPRPTTGPHPPTDYVEVPYPPPAAAAEVVPAQPASDAVWVDGQWTWRDKYYVWQRGGWVRAPKGAYYAPWARYYSADGTLYFADGVWRSERDGRRLPDPVVLLPASSPPGDETPESVISP